MTDDLRQFLASKVDSENEPVVVLLSGGHWITGFVVGLGGDAVKVAPPDGGDSWLIKLGHVVAARVAR